MKRSLVLILVCIVLSAIVFADKKPNKSKAKELKADTTFVDTTQQKVDSVKLSVTDSLQICADSLLQQLNKERELVTPHLDAFMIWLMEGDTVSSHRDDLLQFGAKVIGDMKTLHFQNDSIRCQLVAYHEALGVMSKIQQTLSSSYNAASLNLAEQQLLSLGKYQFNPYIKDRLEVLSKGVRYYKNKMAIRRVGDIIDELFELKADSTLFGSDSVQIGVRDSIFSEIIYHEGRNHLINYVPYAASLRQKIVDAFPYDSDKHVLLEEAFWDSVEAVRKETDSILDKSR